MLVAEIEARAGRPIGFMPAPPEIARIIGNVAALNIVREPGKIVSVDILLPNGAMPPAHVIGHEILHAARSVIDAVPTLLAREQRNAILAVAIGNDAEHLSVIQSEISHFPEAQNFWRKEFLRNLRTLLDRFSEDPYDTGIGRDLIRFWLVTSTVIPCWEGLKIVGDMLAFPPRRESADQLLVDAAVADYQHLVAAIIRSQNRQPHDFLFMGADGKEQEVPNMD